MPPADRRVAGARYLGVPRGNRRIPTQRWTRSNQPNSVSVLCKYLALSGGLGEDPEAKNRVEDHQYQHRELAEERLSAVLEQPQDNQVRQIHGDHMSGHDQGNLQVPDGVRSDEVGIDTSAGGTE